MSSTLLQRPTTQLELLLLCRQMQTTRFDETAALRFLSNAIVSLRDAKTLRLSPLCRYFVAQDGIHALCLGSVYLHGLLPVEREGNRALVLQAAFGLLQMTVADLHRVLAANRQLEEITTASGSAIEERDVRDLIALGDRAMRQARHVYPEWFD